MATGKVDQQVYSAMQNKEPKKRYRKTILGKVHVMVWNPFTNQPEGMIIAGNPKTELDKCIVEIWSDMEDAFFRRMNKRHFETGTLVEHKGEVDIVPDKYDAEFSDEELDTILNSPFLKLQSEVNKMKTIPPLYRLLELAREQEKSEKLISLIEGKMAEIQEQEYGISEDGNNN